VIVAVTGATGYVGQFIVKRLLAGGASVRAWRRPGSNVESVPGRVDWVEGELGSPVSASALVSGADALVHAAFHHVPGRYRGGEGSDLAGFIEKNVGGSLSLLAAARGAGVGRCVVLSSRAVFGASTGSAEIGDDEPPRPDTHYGAAKAALEAFAGSWGRDGWAVASLRPTGVYGRIEPVERSKWLDIVECALRGESVPPRSGSEVHGRDVAESAWRLLHADAAEVAGRTFNCSDIVVSNRDIVAAVQRLADVSGPLPQKAPQPTGLMSSQGLVALGVRFGGRPLFEATVAELVEAACQRGRVAFNAGDRR
jgi:nucleoside-diphosphate-sugar epimerase